jgi:cell division ATPase FtsA
MTELDDIYNSREEQERLAAIMEPRYRRMLRAVHEAIRVAFGLTADQFKLTDSDVNLILVGAARRVVGIDETTRMAIAEQLRVGQALGLSTYEIAHGNPKIGYRGIEGLYRETFRGRSDTIARTELQHAQNESSLNRYRATGMVDAVEIVDGDDWDEPCRTRNGRIVPVSDRPQLNHPNCTLVLIPVLREGVT